MLFPLFYLTKNTRHLIDILLGMFLAALAIFSIISFRLVTTFLHEMGHAIPALLFTQETVVVYIGSYGQRHSSSHFQIGRLQFFFKINIFSLQLGLCEYHSTNKIWQSLLIVFGGPLVSLLIAIPLTLLLVTQPVAPWLFSISVVVVTAATIDFFVNIIPSRSAITTTHGNTYNDGMSIVMLITRAFLSEEYLALEKLYREEKYEAVIDQSKKYLQDKEKDILVYQLLIEAYTATQQYEEALDIYHEVDEHHQLDIRDYYKIGEIYLKISEYEEALKCFNHCFYKDFRNPALLNNLGFTKIQLGDSHEAIRDFQAAINYDSSLVDAYVNLATALMNIGEVEHALPVLEIGLHLAPDHPMLHFYMGRYYQETHDNKQALQHYQYAKELNCTHHGLDYRIHEVSDYIN